MTIEAGPESAGSPVAGALLAGGSLVAGELVAGALTVSGGGALVVTGALVAVRCW